MDTMSDRPILSEEFATKYSGSEDNSSHLEPIDGLAEKKLLWKCDIHVLPMISLLFMLAFIDRVNIGNARIQGLEKDLKMKGQDYNIALFVFFIPYILFEVPSNILLKKIAPSTWLSSIMVCWGMALTYSIHYDVHCLIFPSFRGHHGLPGRHAKLRRFDSMQISAWFLRSWLRPW